jgi:hypothetical protein
MTKKPPTRVTLEQITTLALELHRLDQSPERDFRQKFAYAFDLLIDADAQLQNYAATNRIAPDRN